MPLSISQRKHIQKLRSKKGRKEFGECVVEGVKTILEFANAGLDCQGVWATTDILEKTDIEDRFESIEVASSKEINQISSQKNPEGIVAVFKIPVPSQILSNSWVLALDGVRDPGNLGTIIRTADWFGVEQIVCSTDCVDAFSQKVIQSSMGSVARIHPMYTDLSEWLQNASITSVYGAVLEGGKAINDDTFQKTGVVVIGSESHGIREDVLEKITHRILIPGKGRAESLNASIATAILLSRL